MNLGLSEATHRVPRIAPLQRGPLSLRPRPLTNRGSLPSLPIGSACAALAVNAMQHLPIVKRPYLYFTLPFHCGGRSCWFHGTYIAVAPQKCEQSTNPPFLIVQMGAIFLLILSPTRPYLKCMEMSHTERYIYIYTTDKRES